MRPSALTIAGFDPSGGAGLQADLRVFEALGLAGWSVATAITIQNTTGVHGVHAIDADTLHKQLMAVFADAGDLRAVKIGMLGSAPQVRAVADALRQWKPRNIVLDPVLASTAGVPLLDEEGIEEMQRELVPLCDLVTPNLHERERIGGRAILLKGGHAGGDEAIDVLYIDGHRVREFHAPRIATPHSHGTGCALSAGIAAYLARGEALQEAIARAKALLSEALQHPVITGEGRGYPGVLDCGGHGVPFEGGERRHGRHELHGVYVLTDPRRPAEETIRAALDGGARVVQLREKRLATPQLIELAKRVRAITRERRALFIVNDRVDVALAAGADGVHVGPDDMHPADVRRLMGDRIVGVSVSTVEEAAAVAPYASYFGVGAIFGSQTKLDAGEAVGVARIAEIRQAFPTMPIVAIGGIARENIASVARAGADAAAVVSAVVCAGDMAAATAELVARFNPES